MRPRLLAAAAWLALAGGTALAQTPPPAPTPAPADDIQIVIKGGGERRLAVAVPALYAPGSAALQAKVVEPFTATLRSDLEYAGAFSVTEPAHYPSGFRDPTTPEAADRWLGTGAEVLVDTRGEVSGDRVAVEARVWDLKSRKLILGRKYSGRRVVRGPDRPHARQRPRQVLHGKARRLPLDDPVRVRAGRRTRRSRPWTSTAATSAS